jgi:hypothetical protein
MEREKSKLTHARKAVVAGAETFAFSLLGLVFPPAYFGMIVTVPAAFIEEGLAFRDLNRKFHKMNDHADEQLKRLDDAVSRWDEHEKQCHEPIPPDPETATQKQIEKYKQDVLKAATSPPREK